MTTKIKTYKDLLIWQKGMDLVELSYSLSKMLPEDEKFNLSSQIKRSAVSVPSNIAEGYGRRSTKSFTHFLNITLASLYELETQTEISNRIYDLETTAIQSTIEEMKKMTFGLIQKLEDKNSRVEEEQLHYVTSH